MFLDTSFGIGDFFGIICGILGLAAFLYFYAYGVAFLSKKAGKGIKVNGSIWATPDQFDSMNKDLKNVFQKISKTVNNISNRVSKEKLKSMENILQNNTSQKIDKLNALDELKVKNVITEEEFLLLKSEIINN